jgi:hypothetical protein
MSNKYTHRHEQEVVLYGAEGGLVEVLIDLQAIGRLLGPKALKNKSGRSHILKGAIVVRVVRWDEAAS